MAALEVQQSIAPIEDEQVPTPTLAAKVSKSDLGPAPPTTLLKLEHGQSSSTPSPLSPLTSLGASDCDEFSSSSPTAPIDTFTSPVVGDSPLTWSSSERDEEQQSPPLLFSTKFKDNDTLLTQHPASNHEGRDTRTLISQLVTFPVQLFPSLAAAKQASSSALHYPLPTLEPSKDICPNSGGDKMSLRGWPPAPHPPRLQQAPAGTHSRSRSKSLSLF